MSGLVEAKPSVSAVVPTKNEAENLPLFLPRVAELVDEVVIVDAGSADGTADVARSLVPGAVVVRQLGRGKGSALSAGLARASGDMIVMLDADGSMDPEEIPRFTGALLGGADLVKGSRAMPGGGSEDLTPLRRAGNSGLRALANVMFRQRWTELAYGYVALWRDVVPLLGLDLIDSPSTGGSLDYGHGFEIEALMFSRAARAGLNVVEVPSFERSRAHGASNLRTFPDGWRVLSCLAHERARSAPSGPRPVSPRPVGQRPAETSLTDSEGEARGGEGGL